MFHAVLNGKFEKIDQQKFLKNLNRLDVINISGTSFVRPLKFLRQVSPDRVNIDWVAYSIVYILYRGG